MRRRARTDAEIMAWHKYFAWRPLQIGKVSVWLEFVQRKGTRRTLYDAFGRVTDVRWLWDYELKERKGW